MEDTKNLLTIKEAGVKQQVIRMIETFPEEIIVDAVLKELDDGKGITHEEIEKRIVGRCKGYGNN